MASNKILSIRSKYHFLPKLPNGKYLGKWIGYEVSLTYGKEGYIMETEEGIRGSSSVVVEVKDGVINFDELKN